MILKGEIMRRLIAGAASLAVFGILAVAAVAATPVPFPSTSSAPIFVAAQTVNTSGAMSSWFAPGSTVVFRALALDTKTLKTLEAKKLTYFYVTIPNQPNVKLKYDPTAPGATPRMPWTGQWTVPAGYPAGGVAFKVLAKSTDKRHGSFVQIPVAPSMLNISPSSAAPFAGGPAASGATAAPEKSDLGLYVDTVAGTSPVGVAKRPVGCSQTNVFKRGEQVVTRVWGFDLASGDALTNDNVDTATATIAGVATPLTLGFGNHGTVQFWSTPWIVPATFPLGDVTIHVAFKTDAGKSGTFDYPITIVP
jgi:hypothetical protein